MHSVLTVFLTVTIALSFYTDIQTIKYSLYLQIMIMTLSIFNVHALDDSGLEILSVVVSLLFAAINAIMIGIVSPN